MTSFANSGPLLASARPSSVFSVRVRDDGVAVVTYDVPGEPINVLKASFNDEFRALFADLEQSEEIKAAVLISGKTDSFIVGADIEMLKAVTTSREGEALCRTGHDTIARLVSAKKPIVAAVHGQALGGGFEVALACQGRVLTDDKKTVLGFPEMQLGLLPGLNGLQRLAMLAGIQVALDHGLTAKNMRPSKARQLGVADDVVPRPILEQAAAELALQIAAGKKPPSKKQKPPWRAELARAVLEDNPIGRMLLFKKAREMAEKQSRGHYPALPAIIDVLQTFASEGFEASKNVEAHAFGELAVSPVARRLMDIFFATTALKKDNGADDSHVEPHDIQKVFVFGAGLMGAGIAYVSVAGADLHVRIKDRDDAAVSRGLRSVTDIVDERVKKKQMSPIERLAVLGRLTTTTDDSGLSTADLAIEAVFEDLALKHKVLREFEERGKPHAIFASNTSSIPIGRIADVATRPENVVGMHYFSPVHKMPLLEVIRTPMTSPGVVATAVAVGKKQGKTVIVVNDGVGFYTTRILGPYLNEACWLLLEGAPVDVIDEAMVDWGFPVGPLMLLDEVGIDVAAHVGSVMLAAFGDRLEPPRAIGSVMTDDRKGRKNGRGFYLYGAAAERAGRDKQVDPTIYAALGLEKPRHRGNVAKDDIQMRCALQFVNEALYCWGERILRAPRDGDVGAIFGLGFPPFRGGPFRLVDTMGPSAVLQRMRQYEEAHGKRFTPAPALVEMAKAGRLFYG
jgi:3-hydroxyacyl-CoA dehydrogenase/enoyl-CoA hydratase/3-hydroxybutyryl-CoA epimerase